MEEEMSSALLPSDRDIGYVQGSTSGSVLGQRITTEADQSAEGLAKCCAIIIIPGEFIKHCKLWFWSPHQGRFDIFNDDEQSACSRLDPINQRHITFCMYRLLPTTPPHHCLGIITPDLSPVSIFRPRKDGYID